MTSKLRKYAAYGMNTVSEQMAVRTGASVAVGPGILRDFAFRFAYHADVVPCQGSAVHVVLWDITDEQLEALDRREGYPEYYDRRQVEVEAGGETHLAWVYVMTEGHQMSPPSDRYYAMLDGGYQEFGLPKEQIVTALIASVLVEAGRLDIKSEV